jgi:hypothetical protein
MMGPVDLQNLWYLWDAQQILSVEMNMLVLTEYVDLLANVGLARIVEWLTTNQSVPALTTTKATRIMAATQWVVDPIMIALQLMPASTATANLYAHRRQIHLVLEMLSATELLIVQFVNVQPVPMETLIHLASPLVVKHQSNVLQTRRVSMGVVSPLVLLAIYVCLHRNAEFTDMSQTVPAHQVSLEAEEPAAKKLKSVAKEMMNVHQDLLVSIRSVEILVLKGSLVELMLSVE